MSSYSLTYYTRKEEILNVVTHFAGLILSVAALAILVVFASLYGGVYHIVSFSVFGASMVTLYLASTLYHYAKKKTLRKKLNIFDHAAIYLLIAGTYTPYCLVALQGATGWILFGVTWALALAGIILKLFFTGKYNTLSTVSYVLMGWVAVFAAKPLYESLSSEALMYLLIGGFFYTVGAILYSIEKMPYNHAVFHFFVLGGTISHFISVFFYLL